MARLASPARDDGFVRDPDRDSQADPHAPRELTFVAEHAIWAEADSLLDADAFARDRPTTGIASQRTTSRGN